MSTSVAAPEYFAFVSYSHSDKLWADWLHKALETYRVPSRLVGQVTAAGVIPPRLIPIFRDREELSSANDLSRKVNGALAQSASLVVICSPHAAASRWVNEEVLAFKRLGRGDRIFCLIVAGEPNAGELHGRPADECLPRALRFTIGADGELSTQRAEPIAADARPGRDGKDNAKLKLIAGLLDVGFDALKQRELHRRNRRMIAITAFALFVTLVTTTLAITALIARNAAEVARQSAERRQKQAEDLVEFMLGDLNDKLAQVSRLDIMEAVDDKAMAYFQALPLFDVTDAALAQRAKALQKIGVVRQEQGHLPAAMESFDAASKLAGSLADAAPDDAVRQIAYSRALAFVGMAHWIRGELDAAQSSFMAAQRALQRAQPQPGSEQELLFQLTIVDNNIGHVLEARGRIDEAEAQYRSMLARSQKLVAGTNVRSRWKSQLGSAHNNLGKVAVLRGDLATAVAEYTADDAIESALFASSPENNGQRGNVMRVRAILGRTLALTGDLEGGMQRLREAVEISGQLLKVDPSQAEFQEYAALYSSQLSHVQRLAGDLTSAAALSARSVQIFSGLTHQDAANAVWKQEFGEALAEQAAQSLAGAHRAEARQAARAAVGVLEPLAASLPDEAGVVMALAGARLVFAAATDDEPAARRLRSVSLEALHAGKGIEADPRVLALQVTALLGLGKVEEARPFVQKLWESGYRDPVLTAELQRARVEYPPNAEFQRRLHIAIARGDAP
ncbi:MAG: toll/interleukin-1 receptor domain-containing protein [Rudaea sp.]